jgi:hypothetical protein
MVKYPERLIFCINITLLASVHVPVEKSLAKVSCYMVHVISTVHLFFCLSIFVFLSTLTQFLIKGFLIMVIYSRRKSVWRIWKDGNERKILTGKHGGKEVRGNRKRMQDDNIKMCFKE